MTTIYVVQDIKPLLANPKLIKEFANHFNSFYVIVDDNEIKLDYNYIAELIKGFLYKARKRGKNLMIFTNCYFVRKILELEYERKFEIKEYGVIEAENGKIHLKETDKDYDPILDLFKAIYLKEWED